MAMPSPVLRPLRQSTVLFRPEAKTEIISDAGLPVCIGFNHVFDCLSEPRGLCIQNDSKLVRPLRTLGDK
jgi:hypothetical protein